jgi:hypothetical protein
MKKLLLITLLPLFTLADANLTHELERGIAKDKREACRIAKNQAKENYKVVELNVGCSCEKTDGRDWLCFVGFSSLGKK